MKVVNDFSELPGAGSGSEVGKGVTFQTIAAEQAAGSMAMFNMSPNLIPDIDGYKVTVYSGELCGNKKSHVHVKKAGEYIEFWLEEGLPVKGKSRGFEKEGNSRRAREIIMDNLPQIKTNLEQAGQGKKIEKMTTKQYKEKGNERFT